MAKPVISVQSSKIIVSPLLPMKRTFASTDLNRTFNEKQEKPGSSKTQPRILNQELEKSGSMHRLSRKIYHQKVDETSGRLKTQPYTNNQKVGPSIEFQRPTGLHKSGTELYKSGMEVYKSDVIYRSCPGDFYEGETHQRMILRHGFCHITRKLRTRACTTELNGINTHILKEFTSDHFVKAIGQDKYESVINALLKVPSEELKVKAILALLTTNFVDEDETQKTHRDLTRSVPPHGKGNPTDVPTPDQVAQNHLAQILFKSYHDESCQTDESAVKEINAFRVRKRSKRTASPYIVRDQLSPNSQTVELSDSKEENRSLLKPSLRRSSAEGLSCLNDDWNMSLGKFSFQSLKTDVERHLIHGQDTGLFPKTDQSHDGIVKNQVEKMNLDLNQSSVGMRLTASNVQLQAIDSNQVMNLNQFKSNFSQSNESNPYTQTLTENSVNQTLNQDSNLNQNSNSTFTVTNMIQPLFTKNIAPQQNVQTTEQNVQTTEQNVQTTEHNVQTPQQDYNVPKYPVSMSDGSIIMLAAKPEDHFHIATSENLNSLNDVDKMKLLLHQAYVDLKYALITNEYGNLPIHQAVLSNDLEWLRRQAFALKTRGETVDVLTENGMAALQMSLDQDPACCISLLQLGADPLLLDSEGRTILHLAAELVSDHLHDILQVCRQRARTIIGEHEELWTTQWEANTDEHLGDRVMLHVCSMVDDQGYTPLMLAAKVGNYSAARLLVEASKTSVDRGMPNSGNTALYIAIQSACMDSANRDQSQISDNFSKTIELLLQNGASLSKENYSGITPNMLLQECSNRALHSLINKTMCAINNPDADSPATNYSSMILVKNNDGQCKSYTNYLKIDRFMENSTQKNAQQEKCLTANVDQDNCLTTNVNVSQDINPKVPYVIQGKTNVIQGKCLTTNLVQNKFLKMPYVIQGKCSTANVVQDKCLTTNVIQDKCSTINVIQDVSLKAAYVIQNNGLATNVIHDKSLLVNVDQPTKAANVNQDKSSTMANVDQDQCTGQTDVFIDTRVIKAQPKIILKRAAITGEYVSTTNAIQAKSTEQTDDGNKFITTPKEGVSNTNKGKCSSIQDSQENENKKEKPCYVNHNNAPVIITNKKKVFKKTECGIIMANVKETKQKVVVKRIIRDLSGNMIGVETEKSTNTPEPQPEPTEISKFNTFSYNNLDKKKLPSSSDRNNTLLTNTETSIELNTSALQFLDKLPFKIVRSTRPIPDNIAPKAKNSTKVLPEAKMNADMLPKAKDNTDGLSIAKDQIKILSNVATTETNKHELKTDTQTNKITMITFREEKNKTINNSLTTESDKLKSVDTEPLKHINIKTAPTPKDIQLDAATTEPTQLESNTKPTVTKIRKSKRIVEPLSLKLSPYFSKEAPKNAAITISKIIKCDPAKTLLKLSPHFAKEASKNAANTINQTNKPNNANARNLTNKPNPVNTKNQRNKMDRAHTWNQSNKLDPNTTTNPTNAVKQTTKTDEPNVPNKTELAKINMIPKVVILRNKRLFKGIDAGNMKKIKKS